MYFVVEWVTMSAPHSNGRQFIGVANVLSTTSGTPLLWAMRANFSMSSTLHPGFDMVSPKSSLVFGRKAACISSSPASWQTKVQSMPSFFSVTPKRLYVPPYISVEATM